MVQVLDTKWGPMDLGPTMREVSEAARRTAIQAYEAGADMVLGRIRRHQEQAAGHLEHMFEAILHMGGAGAPCETCRAGKALAEELRKGAWVGPVPGWSSPEPVPRQVDNEQLRTLVRRARELLWPPGDERPRPIRREVLTQWLADAAKALGETEG